MSHMKPVVYILQSLANGRLYIGSTNDLSRRLKQHVAGHTQTTRRLGGSTLVFSQEFDTLEGARKIERRLKSWKRRDFLEKIIEDGRMTVVE